MSKKIIKCKLFHTKSNGVAEYSNSELVGKRIYISENSSINKYENSLGIENSFPYNYSFDTLIDDEVDLGNSIKKKINTVIRCKKDKVDYEYYTHLTSCEKIKLSYIFKNLWFQQASNIMWIINVLVAIGAIMATFCRK